LAKTCIILSVVSLLVISTLDLKVSAPLTPTFSATAVTPINLQQTSTITVYMNGGTSATQYTFRVTVTKPGGVGQAYNTASIGTNSTGGGSGSIIYATTSPAWTTVSGSPASTDVNGTYTVVIDETSPKSAPGVASTTFIVSNVLFVRIVLPSPGSYSRGTSVTITASVQDQQNNYVSGATVIATTPRATTFLLPSTPTGFYTTSYQIQQNDPIGNWNITATATTTGPNAGVSSTLVYVSGAQLVISDLVTYNSNGIPTSDFSPGDSLYASFRVAIAGTNTYVTSGTISIQVHDPAGSTVISLQCVYDTNRGLFYTPSGLQVSTSDPAGSWLLVFSSNSISDTNGNSGPSVTITYRFQVHQALFTISPFWFLVLAAALGGGLGTAVFFRRFNGTTGPFEDLFKLTGGEIRPPATLMIMSDSGAGSTTMALQLLYRELKKEKFCALLSYDAFPSEVARRMRDMGWEITPYLQSGRMKIVDCYSALAGVEGSLIRDPTDFTEVSIQVTGLIDKAKGSPTILLDSVTPIFNAAAAKDCINFLQVLGAKVKNSGGMFIFTAAKGSIPEDVRSKIEALADGVIELNLIKKAKSLNRFLLVRKMAGSHASPVETGFEIAPGVGIRIRRQRVRVGLFHS
jgi:archaellum biogenesis ATPase FlaH